ncbi:MAG: M20/M25/M40 family metallo-hydrolase [Candidatus Eisenbacteria bacterium]
MKRRRLSRIPRALVTLSLLLLLVAGVAACRAPSGTACKVSSDTRYETAGSSNLFSADSRKLASDGRKLASDKMEGRGTGQKGGELAARFIADEFKKANLEPGVGGKSYFQLFDATVGVAMGGQNELRIRFPEAESTYVVEKDFIPFSFSGTGSVSGPVAFSGYGISSSQYNYDDYAQVDVSGDVVLAMRHEPQQQIEDGAFEGKKVTHYSDLRYKASIARDRKAVAVLIASDPLSSEAEEDDLLPLQSLEGMGDCGIPAVQIKRRIADRILATEGTSLRELQLNIDSTLAPSPLELGSVTVSLNVDLVKNRKKVANVVGILEPSAGPAREYVVVGAHYDHLGKGGQFSLTQKPEIHNGADDNASGVAAMMELARLFSAKRDSLKRGLVFVAFSGEELGVLGSTFYVDNPVVPLEKTILMLNLDMVGRMRDKKLYLSGTGSSPAINPIVERANEQNKIVIEKSESGFGPGDHFPFYSHNLPVLFFFTGVHEDYHKPSDDWDKINVEGMASIVELAANVLSQLVFTEVPVPFTRASPDTAGPPGGEGYGRGQGAWFGIVPDFGGEPGKGAKISGVGEGSPAEKAGLIAGDVIVRFADKPITDLHDLTYALREKKPGDEVEVAVVREGKTLVFQATLASRKAK